MSERKKSMLCGVIGSPTVLSTLDRLRPRRRKFQSVPRVALGDCRIVASKGLPRTRIRMALAWLSVLLLASVEISRASSSGLEWPQRPISLVVGFSAGGSNDLIARVIAPELAKRLGQSVVVENLAGAGGTIAAAKVVNAKPDGYTLLMGSDSEVSIAKLVNPALRYDGMKDLAPITLIGTQAMVLVGRASLQAGNVAELLALARSHPGTLSYASSGIGTPLNLAGELIKQKGRLELVHIPYKGASAMTTDLLGGQVDLAVMVMSSALPHIQAGRVVAYGVTTSKRASVAPAVPALSENPELQGVDLGVWFGLMAPSGTPSVILERLNTEMAAVLATAEVRQRLADAGVDLLAAGPARFASFMKDRADQYRIVIQTAGIRQPQ